MAKFTIEYDIHVGDEVLFSITDSNGSHKQSGIVQDVSQMPDVFVEGLQDGEYKRWRRGIDELMVVDSDYDSGRFSNVVFEDNEPVEFVHKGELGTQEFEELEYRTIDQQFQKKRITKKK